MSKIAIQRLEALVESTFGPTQQKEDIAVLLAALKVRDLQVQKLREAIWSLDLFVRVYDGRGLNKDLAMALVKKYAAPPKDAAATLARYETMTKRPNQEIAVPAPLTVDSVLREIARDTCYCGITVSRGSGKCHPCKAMAALSEKAKSEGGA